MFSGADTPMANLMLSVMGAFAEFERSLSKERQREGVALAKARGAYKGGKKVLSQDKVEALRKRAGDAAETKAQIARDFGISRETLYQFPLLLVGLRLRLHPVRSKKPRCHFLMTQALDIQQKIYCRN